MVQVSRLVRSGQVALKSAEIYIHESIDALDIGIDELALRTRLFRLVSGVLCLVFFSQCKGAGRVSRLVLVDFVGGLGSGVLISIRHLFRAALLRVELCMTLHQAHISGTVDLREPTCSLRLLLRT